ncbi:relaxase/mobilization nuclease domain-containing protein [Litorihabitans aurantiacus]|uniref:Mobilization protein n=1 Tax=Litorihabitans aurantiacus TaxID=1930061 RepID=A0AA38CSQ7_9MICO|nr:relaxase [Litorihabitans aurantiacus]GMA33646.1 mobilization protein [Litorihabitans aurantiacus]GMA33713.1 mobilization protein [Litorihabitans aurantiacus]GMA33777.1 mobilization protein [Litorihabitans aurantiacus]
MMPNVSRGDRVSGLLVYLAGPGRHNEHTGQRVITGDTVTRLTAPEGVLNRDDALAIARTVDEPHRAFGVEVKGGHVWHVSLALRAGEGAKSDELWEKIARDFVQAMGFDDAANDDRVNEAGTDVGSGQDDTARKASCRWVAIHHGPSGGGNDHVHIAVSLVREDGTKASTHRDYSRAQKVARTLEERYGLERLESVSAERSTRGWEMGEREAQARRRAKALHSKKIAAGQQLAPWSSLDSHQRVGLVSVQLREDQPRVALARKVRGCAAASSDEAEFVRRLRGSGVLVRPRYAEGSTDVVAGYSVASRPVHGERPIWYGGGRLGRDLTLPRLRSEWDTSETSRAAAGAEWNAAKRARRVAAPGREVSAPRPEVWQQFSKEMESLSAQLRAVPTHDRETWARVARRTSGALAAWSDATEPTPGAMAHAADALSRSAQTFGRETSTPKAQLVAVSGTTMLVASASRGGVGPVGQAALLRSLMNLSKAVHDAALAQGQQRQAESIAREMRGRLAEVHRRMDTAAQAHQPATAAQVPGGAEQQTTAAVATAPNPNITDRMRATLATAQASQAHPATRAVQPATEPSPAKPRSTTRPGPERGSTDQGRE